MKKTIAFSFILALAVMLAWVAGPGVNKVRAQLMPVKTFQIWQRDTDTAGLGPDSDSYYARRSDGATVVTTSTNPVKIVTFPNQGIKIRSTDKDRSTLGSGIPKLAADYAPDCSNAPTGTDLIQSERKQILGFLVIHGTMVIKSGDSGKDGHVEKSMWFAPDLNCHPLEVVATYYDGSGEVINVDTISTTKALIGEPPADAFNVSADNEVPPSKFDTDLGRQPRSPAVSEQRDNRYWKERSQRESKP
jgi:hypothetical protein